MNENVRKKKEEREVIPIKMTERTHRTLRWLVLIGLLLTVGYAFLSFDFDKSINIHSVTASPALLPLILGFIAVFFLWQFTENKLGKFPLTIIKDTPRPKRHKEPKYENPKPNIPNPSSSNPNPPSEISNENRMFDKTSLMIITIGIIFVFMLCIWAVDMSVTALRLEAAGYIAKLDNGWMLQNPALIYHLALYTMILLVAVLVMIAMLNLVRRTDIPWLPLFRPKSKSRAVLTTTTNKKTALFSMVGYTMSMAFTTMVMIFLAVSWTGTTKGLTIIHWNHFGEHNIETALFIAAFVLIVVGFYFTYKNYKSCKGGIR